MKMDLMQTDSNLAVRFVAGKDKHLNVSFDNVESIGPVVEVLQCYNGWWYCVLFDGDVRALYQPEDVQVEEYDNN